MLLKKCIFLLVCCFFQTSAYIFPEFCGLLGDAWARLAGMLGFHRAWELFYRVRRVFLGVDVDVMIVSVAAFLRTRWRDWQQGWRMIGCGSLFEGSDVF